MIVEIDFVPDPLLFPFESRWFSSSAGRMHYVDEGPREGPPILLCHGNPMWSFLYRHMIARLRERYRVVAMDYLGFGLSQRPNSYGYTAAEHVRVVGELVDHLGLDGYVFMGQDWGGPISLGVAVERADRVRGVILGNTWFWPAGPRLRLFSWAMSTDLMQRRILDRNFFVDTLMRRLAPNLTETEMRHYIAVQPSPAARAGVAEFPKQIQAARPLLARLEHDVPRLLGTKPALLVWGMKDPAFPSGSALPRFRTAFPDHVIRKLPHANHYIQEDAHQEIVDAITHRFN